MRTFERESMYMTIGDLPSSECWEEFLVCPAHPQEKYGFLLLRPVTEELTLVRDPGKVLCEATFSASRKSASKRAIYLPYSSDSHCLGQLGTWAFETRDLSSTQRELRHVEILAYVSPRNYFEVVQLDALSRRL